MRKEEVLVFYQKYRIYIYPVIVAFSVLLLTLLVIYPQTVKLLTNQKASFEITKKSDFLQAKVASLEGYDLNDLENKLNYALFSFPVDKDLGVIVGLLQEVVTRSNFTISSLSLGGGSQKNAGAQSYSIKLDVVGPQASLPNLLKNLEGSSRLLRVSSIDTSIGKEGVVSVSLSVEALYSAGPGNFGSIDSSLPEISSDEESLLTSLARVTPPSQILTSGGVKGKPNPFE